MYAGEPAREARVGLVTIGFTTAVAQAVLLREAMAALGGSELAWGLVLAGWLAGVAAGARSAARWRPSSGVAASSGVALVALLGVTLLRAAPALTAVGTGEAPAVWSALWVWLLAVVPPAAAGGAAFAVASSALGDAGTAGVAYALEAGGAVLGGLAFTFALAPLGSGGSLVVTAGLATALGLARRRRLVLAGLVAAVAGGAAWPVTTALERAGWRWAGRQQRLAAWRESHEQRLELGAGAAKSLFADGRLVATLPDPYRAGPLAHLVMLLHPRPERVWMVGGLVDGSATFLLRHPLQRLVALEEDRVFAALLPAWFSDELGAALGDPRLELRSGDPLRSLRAERRWDLILLLDGDPSTVRRNRTRTAEFFRICGSALAPGGMVVVRVGAGDTYLGGPGGRLLAVEATTLRAALGHATAIPGEEVLLVGWRDGAGPTLDPAALGDRWRALGPVDDRFDPALLGQLVDPSRMPALQRFLSDARVPHDTAGRPSAVLVAASLIEGRGHPPVVRAAAALAAASRWWAVVFVGVLSLALVLTRALGQGLAGACAAIVGAASMGWWLLLLSCWQATVGSVFSEVGALSAAFMAGLAGGAWFGRRPAADARRRLGVLLAGGAVVSLLLGAGAPLAMPRTLVVPLLGLGGMLGGASFPAVVALRGGHGRDRATPRMFSADEAGAAAGALLVGLVGLPWLGASGVGLALAAIGLAATSALVAGRG